MMSNLPPIGECKPGFSATEFNVLIAVPPVIEQLKSGLYVPTKTAEADQSASMEGLLVDISPMAGEGVWPKDGPARPQSGDVVWFAKYAGTLVTGDDGREYRVCKDKDIIAVRNRKEP